MPKWQTVPGLQVAIDGPSGSGKGTIAATLGEMLTLPVLDTGLLYRLTGWLGASHGLDLQGETAVLTLLQDERHNIAWKPEGIFYAQEDCTSRLRGEDVGALASRVAAMPQVRIALLDMQREIAEAGCVMDGRDIGTVVLPDAPAKFFLTASQRERARRRWAQLQQKGAELSMDQVMADLRARDERDAGRDCAPLVRADDAIDIDSTTMRPDEVIDRMLAVLERRELIRPA